ncbi:MAG TPA: hypothetical protein VIN08_07500 [Ohtaekwangia sp.]|uniref:hypothetical protein n=1 Tax=Ohtaekwangia sp. TaxID=2066019 RepID=UPI002F93E64F
MDKEIKILRVILICIAVILTLSLLAKAISAVLYLKQPLIHFQERKVLYIYFVCDVLLFILLSCGTFIDKIFFWLTGVITIVVKFILLLSFFLFKPYGVYSIYYNRHYSDFFDIVGWNRLAFILFGNHLLSVFLFSALYSYLIYLYIKIIMPRVRKSF